jgi:hypothetical protein
MEVTLLEFPNYFVGATDHITWGHQWFKLHICGITAGFCVKI